ncbi:MAG TPA: hypothetical protein VGP06_03005 [Janthinobacterium sp.]|jgi:hypothetical protein|nr:hypothetical protein [Janthinobacterium sp.]
MNSTRGEAEREASGSKERTPAQTLEHEEEALDEALEESFPASDPIAVNVEKFARKPAETVSSPTPVF